MYYFAGLNQQEIANKLNLSRIKVVRLLKTALERGLVQISLDKKHFSLYSLEDELMKLSSLKYCVVVPSLPNLKEALTIGLAHLCNDIIRIKGNLGLGLSRSFDKLNLYLDKKKCKINLVVSLCGTASANLALHSTYSGFHIAEALEVDYYTMLAPVVVARGISGDTIKKEHYISMVLDMAQNVDYALIGIGTLNDSQLIDSNYITKDDYKQILSQNVEGEILGHYFTINGKIKPTKIDSRLISVKFPMKGPVIASAGGSAKVRSIVGALRTGLIQGLVTDEDTAISTIKMLKCVSKKK
jgi:DNA-binding transcriptional regulator LsrR (DeoR family)